MSDVDFTKIFQVKNKIDIIDEAWVQDTLEDDDINESKQALDIEGEDADDAYENHNDQELVWNDLGLDQFTIDTIQQAVILTQSNSQSQHQSTSQIQS